MTMNHKSTATKVLLVVVLATVVSGFSVLDRRQAIQKALVGGVAASTAALLPGGVGGILPANAVVDEETPRTTTRMGGLLVRCKNKHTHTRKHASLLAVWFSLVCFCVLPPLAHHLL